MLLLRFSNFLLFQTYPDFLDKTLLDLLIFTKFLSYLCN